MRKTCPDCLEPENQHLYEEEQDGWRKREHILSMIYECCSPRASPDSLPGAASQHSFCPSDRGTSLICTVTHCHTHGIVWF